MAHLCGPLGEGDKLLFVFGQGTVEQLDHLGRGDTGTRGSGLGQTPDV